MRERECGSAAKTCGASLRERLVLRSQIVHALLHARLRRVDRLVEMWWRNR